jgi:hypothetical protein
MDSVIQCGRVSRSHCRPGGIESLAAKLQGISVTGLHYNNLNGRGTIGRRISYAELTAGHLLHISHNDRRNGTYLAALQVDAR